MRIDSDRFGAFAVRMRAAERQGEPVDVCVVTVKATQLETALQRVPGNVLGDALVVPLLNGVEHVALLRQLSAGGGRLRARSQLDLLPLHPTRTEMADIEARTTTIGRGSHPRQVHPDRPSAVACFPLG